MNISPTSLALGLASFRSQALSLLINPAAGGKDDASWSAIFRGLSADGASSSPLAPTSPGGELKGLSPTGRNLGLFDPESAYRMMSVINRNDVSYKAQFSELSQMKAYVAQMHDAGEQLGGISQSTGNQAIAAQLTAFVSQYNRWTERFDPDLQKGGLLADTQAAQVSRYELAQSVKNIFNGAADGVHGLGDLGVTIDPASGLASLDTGRLDALLASNKPGAVNALREFSANFAKSASLLNADGNFIPNRLNNLDKVIDYFAEHQHALQEEFGTGDAAAPSGVLAQALAAYRQNFGSV